MIALFASIFSLFVGPLVYQTFGPLRRTDKIVTGIVLIVVAGTIIFEVLPTSYQYIGLAAVFLCLIGFAGPTLIERTFRKAADTTHKLTILLGVFGLLLHAFIDGMAIQPADGPDSNGMALAIILHRLPIGLTIWWLLKPLLGERYALGTLLLMGLSTVVGYFSSQAFALINNSDMFAALQALVAGSLLHVVIHKPHSDGCMHTSHDHEHHHNNSSSKAENGLSALIMRWELLGMLLGGIILGAMYLYMH